MLGRQKIENENPFSDLNSSTVKSLIYAEDTVVVPTVKMNRQRSLFQLARIAQEYIFTISDTKVKTMALKGKWTVKSDIVF